MTLRQARGCKFSCPVYIGPYHTSVITSELVSYSQFGWSITVFAKHQIEASHKSARSGECVEKARWLFCDTIMKEIELEADLLRSLWLWTFEVNMKRLMLFVHRSGSDSRIRQNILQTCLLPFIGFRFWQQCRCSWKLCARTLRGDYVSDENINVSLLNYPKQTVPTWYSMFKQRVVWTWDQDENKNEKINQIPAYLTVESKLSQHLSLMFKQRMVWTRQQDEHKFKLQIHAKQFIVLSILLVSCWLILKAAVFFVIQCGSVGDCVRRKRDDIFFVASSASFAILITMLFLWKEERLVMC